MAPGWGLVNLLHHCSDVLCIFAFCSLSRAQCYAGGCCVHLFVILHSVTSLWQFEISHGGRVYTEKIGTCYKQNFKLLNIYQCAIGDNPSSPANFLVKLCIPDQSVDFFLLPIKFGLCQVGMLQNSVLLFLVEKDKLILDQLSY